MKDKTQVSLYTIGHSTHTIKYFLSLLKKYNIQAIADVRSNPYSKFNPQFSKEELKNILKMNNISYVFLGNELGARRKESECYRNNKVDYDLIAKTVLFKNGIKRILDGANKMKIAILCAEKDPLTCHRSILISRYIDSNNKINHILSNGSIETQKEAEARLLKEYESLNKDLFSSYDEQIANAYNHRASEIAYEKPIVNSNVRDG